MAFRPHSYLFLLLFVTLFNAIRAQGGSPAPAPGSFPTEPQLVILTEGDAIRTIIHPYTLGLPLPRNTNNLTEALSVSLSITQGAHIIASAELEPVEYSGDPEADPFDILFEFKLIFNSLPGLVTAVLSLKDPAIPDRREFLFNIYVVGIALYTGVGDSQIVFSGRSARRLVLPAPGDDNRIRTVNATVYASSGNRRPDDKLDPHKITLALEGFQGDNPLPWDTERCRVFNEPEDLDDLCSMAFSPDFSTFSIRVPDGTDIDRPLKLVFSWKGLKDIRDEFGGDGNGVEEPIDQLDDLKDDQITTAAIEQEPHRPAWQIAVIVVVTCLLVGAIITLACCCVYARKKKSPKRPKPFLRGVDPRGHQMNLQELRVGAGEDNDKCFVEEPSSYGVSTILMLENEPRRVACVGVAAGLVPPETTPSKELSAARLVLPREVTRGVDLEPSTEGGSMRFPLSGNDVTSYGRGMTSVPKDMYRNGECDLDEIEDESPQARSAGDLRIVTTIMNSTEDRVGIGEPEGAVARGGVGAAINRVRQVDLLNGPHSKGLVGRNGEPIQQEEPAHGSAKVLTLSNVS